jgi:hypothetical protein
MAIDTFDRALKRISISLTNYDNHVMGSLRDPFQMLLSWSSIAFGIEIVAMEMYSTSNEDSLDQVRVAGFKAGAIYDEKNWEDLVDYVAGKPDQYVMVLLHAQPKVSFFFPFLPASAETLPAFLRAPCREISSFT